MNVAVVGFGARAPAPVLDLLTRLNVSSGSTATTIKPYGSQQIQFALSKPPYRVLQRHSNSTISSLSSKDSFDLVLFCAPTTADYLQTGTNGHEGSKFARALCTSPSTVVYVYDPTYPDSLTSQSDKLIEAVTSSPTPKNGFNSASMLALSKLDVQAANQLSETGKQDTVIVVGGGGREHALCVALAKSPLVGKVIAAPGNGGTYAEASSKIENITGEFAGKQDNATILALVKLHKADMVVVGPEQPLVDGLVDELKVAAPQVRAFGPTKAAAELEASKAFTKDFLKECGIRTASYENFTSCDEAVKYVTSLPDDHRVVVKASGLAAGKGVLIPETKDETVAAVKEIMSDKTFGTAGDTCVIEQFMTGPEASCLCFCDGKTAKLMPAAQDHKRANDGDQGLNTGGMGAYAPAPCVTPQMQDEIEEMCQKTVTKMAEKGTPYVGVLYAGIMCTPSGPSMLEYNCRFGDPETQVVLPLLETDLYEVFMACCDGNLEDVDVRFRDGIAAATVVCAAKGYPEKYPKGMKITGLEAANALEGVKVYHAGTKIKDSDTVCSGGRVLAITGVGSGLKVAVKTAYNGVSKVDFVDTSDNSSHLHNRTDIAHRAISKKLRIGVMGSTRGTALIPLIEALANGELNAEIVAVVSNRSAAPILDKGRALGPTVVSKFVSAKNLSRAEYDAECTSVLVAAGAEMVILVGYMRILSPEFCRFWENKCINVHPSLLPKHGGLMDLEVHQAVIDAKETESGCSIHMVTEEVDGGEVIIQKKVAVEPTDTAETLKAKVQTQEGIAFIEAIAKFSKTSISYADAGVDIVAGANLVEMIKPACKRTRRAGCDADLGGFGSLFDLSAAGYAGDDVVIVGATDGVGTKLRIAQGAKIHSGVGIDLVAMCVNDLIVTGAEPLFFLDYYATGHLDVHEAAEVVKGIAEGCYQAQCGLVGGETAEMPSMYAPGDYDLGGFAVGAVRKPNILPANVKTGDVLIGVPSSGIHSNGFSLVRRLLAKEGLDWNDVAPWGVGGETVAENLLAPTKIYVRALMPLVKKGLMNGSAHITGGGLLENLNRSLTDTTNAEVNFHPPLTPVFKWMQQASGLGDEEMLKTFNCGVGFVLIVDAGKAQAALECLKEGGEEGFLMGKLVPGTGDKLVNVTCKLE
ncbi:hypothetical protein TrST_g11753 [Triparma strigata]|uniref:Phosphoribosylformylglycinamidine cyclo-ligase n=1 Tax=Triparma strigata TaxID=1606541 RepID=A0A9W7AZU3_9STRA|nr:hypothetical protein TrST_g11753 [Triparma strigata]